MSDDAMARRRRYLARLTTQKTARSSWEPEWRDLSLFIQPRKGRFFTADANKGTRKGLEIINAAATRALKVQASGMFAGVTSPAQPWIYITTEDPDLSELDAVREWLDLLARRTLSMLAKTNIYNELHATYQGIGCFGTHAFLLEEDEKTVLRAYPQPLGEYCLATDERGEVDTLLREMRMTVRQVVRRFGLDVASRRVREAYQAHRYDEWVDVLHVIEPREQYDGSKADGRNKPWASCWMETNCGTEDVGFLDESGYEENPILAPRWDVLGEDVYGTGPGHEVLGDVKALQLYEERKAQAVERMVDPPLVAIGALEGTPLQLKPGHITYADGNSRGPAVAPLLQVMPAAVTVTIESIRETVQRIQQGFGADMWLMMSDAGDPQRTAREVAERHEEKLLQLGPVMERLEGELLTPMVTRAIQAQLRRKMLPPPPEAIQGQQIRLQYMSVMARAQRMVRGTAVQQFTGFVQSIFAFQPNVADKVNTDEMVVEMVDALGLPPKVLVSDDEVQAVRQQRAQMVAQQHQAEVAAQQAAQAKTLSQADTEGDNALTRLLGGAAAAQVQG